MKNENRVENIECDTGSIVQSQGWTKTRLGLDVFHSPG